MDLSKLTDDQLDVAFKVTQEAKRQGINPDFVLPLVMAESQFNQKAVSPKKAIGVMQLMPDTAKELGVDPTDVDQNIKGGITYLKQLMQNPNVGGDPNRLLMAYNAGPNSKFFQTGSLQDLPDETLNYVANITSGAGGQLPQFSMETQESEQAAPVSQVNFDQPKLKTLTVDETGAPQQVSPVVGGIVGGVSGALTGTTAAVSKAKIDAATEAYEAIKRRMQAAQAPAETGQTPGGKWAAKTGYGIGEGTTQETSSRYQRAVPKGKVSGPMAKLWGIAQPGENPQLAQRLIDRAREAEAAAALGTQTTGKASPFLSYASRLAGLPVKGALYGAGVGFSAADAYNRYRAGEPNEAAIAAGSGLAGLAAPFMASAGALPAAAVAGPLYLTASDRIKHLAKHPEDVQLYESGFDPMGNLLR